MGVVIGVILFRNVGSGGPALVIDDNTFCTCGLLLYGVVRGMFTTSSPPVLASCAPAVPGAAMLTRCQHPPNSCSRMCCVHAALQALAAHFIYAPATAKLTSATVFVRMMSCRRWQRTWSTLWDKSPHACQQLFSHVYAIHAASPSATCH